MTANPLIDGTLGEIARDYQRGALCWMKVNTPNEWGKMLILEREINEIALESDTEGLRKVLSEYQSLILAMLREFKSLKEKKGQEMFRFVDRPKSPQSG